MNPRFVSFAAALWDYKRGLREHPPIAADFGLDPRNATSIEYQVHVEFEREQIAKTQREREARAQARMKI